MILVDAHALIFQVFHAIRDPMTSPSGLPTNALFGFVRDLLFLRSQKPDYLVCAFDHSEKTFRTDLYPAYKAHRAPMPDDLVLQLPLIRTALHALNVPAIELPNFEADDLLATIARAAAERGLEVWICTSDKDCRQLITDRVRMYNLRKREEFGRQQLLDDWGVTPEQVVDLQTLVGDTVDNVPGVPGIGVKTGAKLLQEYGSLEKLLANVDKIPGKKGENIRATVPLFEKSRTLVRLVDDVPVPMDWETWKLQPVRTEEALALFQEWGFRTFAQQMRQQTPETQAPRQTSLFGDDDEAPPIRTAVAGTATTNGNGLVDADATSPSTWQATYHLVATADAFEEFIGRLSRERRFAIDLETTGLDPLQCDIVGLSFCWQEGEAHYLAVRGPASEPVLDPAVTLARLKPILEDPQVQKINQNIKYDLLVLRAHDIHIAGVAGDSMVADYLLHAGERSHGIDDLSRRYLKHEKIKTTELIGERSAKKPQICMDQVPTRRVADYACEDADAAWRLAEFLEPQLGEGDGALRKLYDELEVPLIDVLAAMEFAGVRINVEMLRKLSGEMEMQLRQIEAEIYRVAGREFNIGSLPQLRKILFDELKLPQQRRTGVTGAASTDQQTLEVLAAMTHIPGHELPRMILEQRQVSKLKSTYVDALPSLVNPKTGRVHASFNQTVAATGRLSSSDPNLQNIPVRREMGQQIRQAFIPEEGWTLLTADYSQIELRLMAHFSGDATLRQAFAEDRDVHSAVAAQIFGVQEADVSSEQRRMAKTVNFGIIYGMSAGGLAQRLQISRDEGVRFIDRYFKTYPRVLDYQTKLLENCRKSGYVTTILGRRRRIEGIRPRSTYQQRSQPEREAINMEIQGSAADLIKLAMLNLHRRIGREKMRSRMLMQIHDELVFEAPPEEMSGLAAVVREEMTTPLEKMLKLEVPLKVDMGAGRNWLEVEEMR